MSEKNLQTVIEELSVKVAQRVKELQEQGKDPRNDSGVQKILDELLEKRAQLDKENNAKRMGDEFEEMIDPDKLVDSKDFNPYDPKTGISKILMPKNVLKRVVGDRLADSIEEFKELNDQAYLVGMVLAAKHNMPYTQALRRTKSYKLLQQRLQMDSELRKALATGNTGQGAEWIPTGFSSQLLEKIRLELRVAANFVTINMPTNPYKFPVQSAGATSYLITENTTDTPTKFPTTTPGTANFEFVAKKLGGRILFSEEVNEDSIINMMDFSRRELAIAIAEGLEDAILNGDDSATHMDANVTASNDRKKAFKGLRKLALLNANGTLDFAGSAPTTNALRNLRRKLGKYGVNPANLVYVISPAEYYSFLNIPEVLTMDKIGNRATILNGQLLEFDGVPVLISEFVPENLNASGVYDGTTTTRTVIHLFDKRGFMLGQRGGVTVQTWRDVESDVISVIAKYRVAFKDPYDATSQTQTVLGVNVPY